MEVTIGNRRRWRGRRSPDDVAWRIVWLLAILVTAGFVWARMQPPDPVVRTDVVQRAILDEEASDPLPAVVQPGL